MSNTMLCNVAFGRARADQTGSMGVGYTVMDVDGNIVFSRNTAGVYELVSGSGLYAANVAFPDNFNGQIVWDCPPVTSSLGLILSQSFATEQYNVQSNDPIVEATYTLLSGTIAPQVQGLYDVAFGCWRIDPVANTMTFYKGSDDSSPVVAVFDLYDQNGNPTYDGVFERVLIGSVMP
jgi:hypothetical protein